MHQKTCKRCGHRNMNVLLKSNGEVRHICDNCRNEEVPAHEAIMHPGKAHFVMTTATTILMLQAEAGTDPDSQRERLIRELIAIVQDNAMIALRYHKQ